MTVIKNRATFAQFAAPEAVAHYLRQAAGGEDRRLGSRARLRVLLRRHPAGPWLRQLPGHGHGSDAVPDRGASGAMPARML